MIVFDTTILVYAVGMEHPLRSPCRAVMEFVRDGVVRGGTTVEVIQEFAHVRSRRVMRTEAVETARTYALAFSPLLRPDEHDLDVGLSLFESIRDLGSFDAVLAAYALRSGSALVSADRSFENVKDLVHLNPSSPTFLNDIRPMD